MRSRFSFSRFHVFKFFWYCQPSSSRALRAEQQLAQQACPSLSGRELLRRAGAGCLAERREGVVDAWSRRVGALPSFDELCLTHVDCMGEALSMPADCSLRSPHTRRGIPRSFRRPAAPLSLVVFDAAIRHDEVATANARSAARRPAPCGRWGPMSNVGAFPKKCNK